MNIIEKLKEEKGIANIDTFREFVGELIDEAIENNIYISALENKMGTKCTIETLIMRTYRNENLKEVEVDMIKTLARVCCSNLLFDITLPEKSYRDILFNCIYDYLSVNDFCDENNCVDSDSIQALVESNQTLNEVVDLMEYVESGRVPESELDDIPISKLETSIKAIINYLYKDSFKDC